jgi:hypothetical protein
VDHVDGRSATYRVPSGATLTVHVSPSNRFECVQPGFEGSFRGRWRPLGIARDPDCSFCDLVYAELLEADDMLYPFGLTVETIGAAAPGPAASPVRPLKAFSACCYFEAGS